MKIEYSGDNPQYLGILNNKPCTISKEEPLNISKEDLLILKRRKWFNHLVSRGLIKINEKTEQTEQDEKPKKKKKEKTIQIDMD